MGQMNAGVKILSIGLNQTYFPDLARGRCNMKGQWKAQLRGESKVNIRDKCSGNRYYCRKLMRQEVKRHCFTVKSSKVYLLSTEYVPELSFKIKVWPGHSSAEKIISGLPCFLGESKNDLA